MNSRTWYTRPLSDVKITRGHSCVVCAQRKVKCDGQRPCAACQRNHVECISKTPSAPRRRARVRATKEEQLLERLQRCEGLLQLHGLHLDDHDHDPLTATPSRPPSNVPEDTTSPASAAGTDRGKLIMEAGQARYIENDLWTDLGDEFDDTKAAGPGTDDEDNSPALAVSAISSNADNLVFGHPTMKSLAASHPTPVQIFLLWQTFLDNVNPLLKLFHAPTVQQSILDAASNLENIPKSTEALMFAIYFLSITSLRNNDCEKVMGESRPILLARFSSATQQALINAELLKTTDMTVLQAFVLFLLAMRPHYDPHTLWLLSGLAVRMGQKLGLHHESASKRLSIFEAEIRRRLWWQIAILDFRSAQLSGTNIGELHLLTDTARPLNVNDSDLSPSMKEPPKEYAGTTDMLFCSIRYEIGDFMRESGIFSRQRSTSAAAMAAKDKAIDDLEKRLEQKYVRYCDDSIPLHYLSLRLAKTAVWQMRLLTHHPRQYPDNGASMPDKEKNMLFSTSLKMIEGENVGQSNESIQGFLWHVNYYLQLDALIYLLGELRNRFEGSEVDSAWQQIEQAYGNHPEILSAPKNSLYFAIGSLAIKAWDKRAAAVQHKTFYQLPMPYFISVLHSQRRAPNIISNNQFNQTNLPGQYQQAQAANMAGNWDMNFNSNDMAMDASPMDWEYWQALMDESVYPVVDVNGQQMYPME